MSNGKHVLILVPDGVGIKNYLYSQILTYLKEDAKISIWSTLPIEAFSDVKDIHNLDFDYKQIVLLPENILTRLYREATTYARLIYNSKLKSNPTILTNWREPKHGFKVKLLYRVAKIFGSYLSNSYSKILKFEAKSIKNISPSLIDNYSDELKRCDVNTIFITHQRVPGLMPICLAAKQLNIKTATAIFSWDNLPKARLAVKTDEYFVWSQWMKDEMKDYYKEIPQENVKLVGTPQFEFYMDKSRIIERNDFAIKYGLDTNKKWICFSGDDKVTSPYDEFFLRDLAEQLWSEKDRLQIIFRRCPVDFSSRYDNVLLNNKDFIIPINPIWNNESETGWTGFFPKYEDIDLQINLAQHCELVTNLGSTMAVDFITFNKPCLYLNYNPSNDISWSTEIIYNFQHFRSIGNLEAVGWIDGKDDILQKILETLKEPLEVAKDRKEWMSILVNLPIDKNSENIAKVLL